MFKQRRPAGKPSSISSIPSTLLSVSPTVFLKALSLSLSLTPDQVSCINYADFSTIPSPTPSLFSLEYLEDLQSTSRSSGFPKGCCSILPVGSSDAYGNPEHLQTLSLILGPASLPPLSSTPCVYFPLVSKQVNLLPF
jgi:hypothetical protein